MAEVVELAKRWLIKTPTQRPNCWSTLIDSGSNETLVSHFDIGSVGTAGMRGALDLQIE